MKKSKYKVCKECGTKLDDFYFRDNSDICQFCITNKKQNTIKLKNERLAIEEVPQYVYKMLDKHSHIVYVGKTENMDRRMKAHHIFEDEDDLLFRSNSIQTIIPIEDLHKIKKVYFSKLPNNYYASIYEIQLIAKYMPKYNTQFKYYSKSFIKLYDLKWTEYYSCTRKDWAIQMLYLTLRKDFPSDLIQKIKDVDTRYDAVNEARILIDKGSA